jgi:hypothetical protein
VCHTDRISDILELRRPAVRKQKPATITIRAPRRFTVLDHTKLLSYLIEFGFPSMELFSDSLDPRYHSCDTTFRYVDHAIRFCSAAGEEKGQITALFLEKLPTDAALKIPQRLELFKEIWMTVMNYQDLQARIWSF